MEYGRDEFAAFEEEEADDGEEGEAPRGRCCFCDVEPETIDALRKRDDILGD
jgi:hypothetical protein